MGLRRRAEVAWLGMVLAGAALAAFVYLSWPEPATRFVRLPYGEALPKTPVQTVTETRTVFAFPPVSERPAATVAAAPTPEQEPERELSVVPAAEPVLDGPPPVPSELEDDGYVESAEELGARPLPGMETSPALSLPAQQPDGG